MAVFNVPVSVKIEANSAADAAELVRAFLEYAQDVGNDDGAVKSCHVGTEAEITTD